MCHYGLCTRALEIGVKCLAGRLQLDSRRCLLQIACQPGDSQGVQTYGPHAANRTCARSQRYRWQAILWTTEPTVPVSHPVIDVLHPVVRKMVAILFLKSNNWMVFIMGKKVFICEVRTELLFVIGKKFSLRFNPSKMNFKISAHAQFC